MIEGIIYALIYLCLLVLVVLLVLYVLQQLGITIPPAIVKMIWIIVMLVALLIILRVVVPGAIGKRLVELSINFLT